MKHIIPIACALLTSLLFLTACGDEPTASQEETAKSAPATSEAITEKAPPLSQPAPQEPRHGKGHKRFGDPLVNTLHAVLEGVDLTEEQKTAIEALHKKPDGIRAAYRQAKGALYEALSQAVASGDFEAQSFEPHLTAIAAAKASKREARMKMVTGFHGLLTPEQRKTVAETARELLSEEKGECPCAKGAHGDCPLKDTPDCPHHGGGPGDCPFKDTPDCPHHGCGPGDCPFKDTPDCPHHKGGQDDVEDGTGGPGCPYAAKGHGKRDFSRLLAGIELTGEQRQQVAALESAPAFKGGDFRASMRHQHLVQLFEAFENETIDVSGLERGPRHEEKGERMSALVERTGALLKILDKAQQETLAANLSQNAARLTARTE